MTDKTTKLGRRRRRRGHLGIILLAYIGVASIAFSKELTEVVCRTLVNCFGYSWLCDEVCIPPVDRLTVVYAGSSSVFPIMDMVAEKVRTDVNARRIEGPNLSLDDLLGRQDGGTQNKQIFCNPNADPPRDIFGASRRQGPSFLETCSGNGVGAITELRIGEDAILLLTPRGAGQGRLALSETALFLAFAGSVPVRQGEGPEARCTWRQPDFTTWKSLFEFARDQELDPVLFSKNGPARSWNDIIADAGDWNIKLYVPTETSGTRSGFVDMAMRRGALSLPCGQRLWQDNPDEFLTRIATFRRSGVETDRSAEDDEGFLLRLSGADPDTIGFIGSIAYFRGRNSPDGDPSAAASRNLRALPVNGIPPDFNSIRNETYPLTRALYLYIKDLRLKGFERGVRSRGRPGTDFTRCFSGAPLSLGAFSDEGPATPGTADATGSSPANRPPLKFNALAELLITLLSDDMMRLSPEGQLVEDLDLVPARRYIRHAYCAQLQSIVSTAAL